MAACFNLCSAVLVVIAGVLTWYLSIAGPVVDGMVALRLCSCVFVGGRDVEHVWQHELKPPHYGLAKTTVDFQSKKVTAALFGFAFSRTAFYREGLGCSLSHAQTEGSRMMKPLTPPQPPTDYTEKAWPYGNAPGLAPMPPSVDGEALKNVVKQQISTKNSRAILVAYKGKLILEQYKEGFNADSKQLGWSMTKSLLSMLVGVRVDEGRMSLEDQPLGVGTMYEHEDKDFGRKVTLDTLLRASSGLVFDENYSPIIPADPSVMLFQEPNAAAFAATKPKEHEPDTHWKYSSGTTNIISHALRESFKKGEGESERDYWEFPTKRLFGPIGAYSFVMETDSSDNFLGSSLSWATARDWARVGQLMLNQGEWGNQQVLSEDWVNYSIQPTPTAPQGQYGAQWWLNSGNGPKKEKKWPKLPKDFYWMDGYESQLVAFIPSKQLVIVHLGCMKDATEAAEEELLSQMLKAFA